MTSDFLNIQDVTNQILEHVKKQHPFSFVRLGDGEGSLLQFSEESELQDYAYLMQHVGPFATIYDVYEIQDGLQKAISSANFLGIRDDVFRAPPSAASLEPTAPDFLKHFTAIFPLRESEKNRLDQHGARRIFALWEWWKRQKNTEKYSVCSPWVVNDLQQEGFWEELINSQNAIGLINSSPKLSQRLSRRFSVELEYIQIPSNPVDPGPGGVNPLRHAQHSTYRKIIG